MIDEEMRRIWISSFLCPSYRHSKGWDLAVLGGVESWRYEDTYDGCEKPKIDVETRLNASACHEQLQS